MKMNKFIDFLYFWKPTYVVVEVYKEVNNLLDNAVSGGGEY